MYLYVDVYCVYINDFILNFLMTLSVILNEPHFLIVFFRGPSVVRAGIGRRGRGRLTQLRVLQILFTVLSLHGGRLFLQLGVLVLLIHH